MTEKDYNECVSLYADNVYRFIVKNLRHEEDARDVVQTAFEKLWRNREGVDAAKSKSYLFTVAYNQMIDHLRKVKRVYLKDEFKEEAKVQNRHMDNAKAVLNEALTTSFTTPFWMLSRVRSASERCLPTFPASIPCGVMTSSSTWHLIGIP